MTAAVRVGSVAFATILGLCSLSAPPLPSSSSCPPSSVVATGFHNRALTPSDMSVVVAKNAAGVEEVKEWDAEGSPDLYGNEVIDAVTRYRLDDAGSLCEVHSPQTELPRLTSPIG